MMANAVLAIAAAVLYFTVSDDYAFLRAPPSLPGLRADNITPQGSGWRRAPSRGTAT